MKKIYLKKLSNYLLLALTIVLVSNCKKDETLTLNNDAKLKASLLAASNPDRVSSQKYYIEDALPSNFVKNGTRDYTDLIQEAISNHDNIVFPAFPILINDTGLDIPSNRILTFPNGSELRLKPSLKNGYGLLNMRKADNVTLINPVLIGDRDNHRGAGGEWGMGITVYGGSNITIEGAKVSEMWGDGIYLGVEQGDVPNNITIKNAYLTHNRRDGITITGADGLNLESCYAAFSDGTKPMAGIAFEPNFGKTEIKNVVINNPKTEGNAGAGIFADMGNLMGSGDKKIDVTINNHFDLKSYWGLKVMSRVTDGSSHIKGDFKLINPIWSQNTFKAIQTTLFGDDDVHLVINNPIIRDVDDKRLDKDETFGYMMEKIHINPRAWSAINFSSDWPNHKVDGNSGGSVKGDDGNNGKVVYAINCGGSSFTSPSGVKYIADKYFTGGDIYETSRSVSGTDDDIIYKSERYGDFSYALPIKDGIYQITLQFAEIYHSEANKRQFNVFIEGDAVIRNLDINKINGSFMAYDVTKTVEVTDGILNLGFTTNIDNAKLSAFQVVKVN